MFDKILSSLPFNPSLIHQLSFYAKRIKKESAVRRTGLVFIVFAFLIQFFAFISPPQATLAESPNDLFNGGFANATQAANACQANLQDYGTILANYGITCDKVRNAPTVTLNSDNYNKMLFSMGRLPYDLTGETPVCIPTTSPCAASSTTYYIRYLWAWDKPGTSSTYQMLDVTTAGGQRIFIMLICGNLASVGRPIPVTPTTPPPVPKPKPPCAKALSTENAIACIVTSKSAINLTQGKIDATTKPANSDDLIRYYLYAKNTGTTEVKDYQFSDNLSYVLDYANPSVLGTGRLNTATQTIIYPKRNIPAKTTASVYFEVRVKNPIPQTPASPSDPNYFNMQMTNTYGNTIIIHLPNSPFQTVETTTTTTLPNTGPGTGLGIAAVVMVFAGFFYYRSRLLAKEAVIVINESTKGL